MMNNHEWTEEQKRKLVEIDRQERRRKNFMKSVKARWDSEYLESRKTAQNLTDNARRFKKEGWGRPAELDNWDKTEVQPLTQVIREQQQKSIELIMQM